MSQGHIYNNNPGFALGDGQVSVALDLDGNERYNTQHASGDWKSMGLLFDTGGDDLYTTSGWQGSGQSTAIGYLRDIAGSDVYTCNFSCQGSGDSKGIGILWDSDGDDDYIKTSSRGQGHGRDKGVGLLIDQGGADYYIATGTAQGFSSLGGVGVLVDRSGADTYNVSGMQFGRATHDPGSPNTMIFLDMDGDDNYQPRADGGTPPDSRDATAPLNKYVWGPGSTGTFYIKGRDCEVDLQNCLPENLN